MAKPPLLPFFVSFDGDSVLGRLEWCLHFLVVGGTMRPLGLALMVLIPSTIALAPPARVSGKELRAKAMESGSAMQSCYQSYQEREPHRFGRVYFDFRILPSGEVSAVQLSQTDLGDAAFIECVLSNVARWRFGPTLHATQVNGFHIGFQP